MSATTRFALIEGDGYQGDIFEGVAAGYEWLAGRTAAVTR